MKKTIITNGIYELQPQFDSAKSFYERAVVKAHGAERTLISYDTEVATANVVTNVAKVNGTYSKTTLRHIKEFLKQNGFRAETKAQIERDYMN